MIHLYNSTDYLYKLRAYFTHFHTDASKSNYTSNEGKAGFQSNDKQKIKKELTDRESRSCWTPYYIPKCNYFLFFTELIHTLWAKQKKDSQWKQKKNQGDSWLNKKRICALLHFLWSSLSVSYPTHQNADSRDSSATGFHSGTYSYQFNHKCNPIPNWTKTELDEVKRSWNIVLSLMSPVFWQLAYLSKSTLHMYLFLLYL